MSELPAPLVPAEVDLRDFAFMPLDIIRLFGSRFHAIASDAEWRAGVTLWAKSFHQVPAASVPDDDIELCRLAELGRDLKAWKKVREVALHGWVKCNDGRLYHPVVSEKANEAWARKQAQRARSAKGNAARWGSRDRDGNESGGHEGTAKEQHHHPQSMPEASQKESLKDPKGQGQGQGQGQGIPEYGPAAPTPPPAAAAAPTPRGTRLPADWVLPKPWGDWALAEYPHWTGDIVRRLGQTFADHWHAKAGKDATKLDWFATWRNWCSGAIAQRQFPPPRHQAAPPSTAERDAEARRLLGFAPAPAAEVIDA